ncbi:hypothetical protein Gpo141_00011908 [Globisporangium polare]
MVKDGDVYPATLVPQPALRAAELQYETIMKNARPYLQRRDLASYDEVPLYFAWERLYATANANLSIDFIGENQLEFSQRKESRLAPRRGSCTDEISACDNQASVVSD